MASRGSGFRSGVGPPTLHVRRFQTGLLEPPHLRRPRGCAEIMSPGTASERTASSHGEVSPLPSATGRRCDGGPVHRAVGLRVSTPHPLGRMLASAPGITRCGDIKDRGVMPSIRPVCAKPGCARSVPRRSQTYCSRLCYRAAIRRYPPVLSAYRCAQCGGSRRRADRPYCGRACAAAARVRPRPPCRQCGAPIPRAGRVFCGVECAKVWQRAHPARFWLGKSRPQMRGANHPRWAGDDASEATKRARVRRRVPVVRRCELCFLAAVRVVPHGDPDALVWRCRGCLARLGRPRRRKPRTT